jgi:hypothetical protein
MRRRNLPYGCDGSAMAGQTRRQSTPDAGRLDSEQTAGARVQPADCHGIKAVHRLCLCCTHQARSLDRQPDALRHAALQLSRRLPNMQPDCSIACVRNALCTGLQDRLLIDTRHLRYLPPRLVSCSFERFSCAWCREAAVLEAVLTSAFACGYVLYLDALLLQKSILYIARHSQAWKHINSTPCALAVKQKPGVQQSGMLNTPQRRAITRPVDSAEAPSLLHHILN